MVCSIETTAKNRKTEKCSKNGKNYVSRKMTIMFLNQSTITRLLRHRT